MSTIEEKIEVFEDHFNRRHLNIANILARHFQDDRQNDELSECGFVLLSITIQYFEAIAQFINGKDSRGDSKGFFRTGFYDVYPSSPYTSGQIDNLWDIARNGMFHSALPKQAMQLDRTYSDAFTWHCDEWIVNPAKVVEDQRSHFEKYCGRLRNSCETNLRERFDQMCLLRSTSDKSLTAQTSGTPDPNRFWRNS